MTTLKRLLLAYCCGAVTVLALALYAGPEILVQTGLRLDAVQTSYDWQAVPREATPVSYATRELLVSEPKAKRR